MKVPVSPLIFTIQCSKGNLLERSKRGNDNSRFSTVACHFKTLLAAIETEMKIDFSQHVEPATALDLPRWRKNVELEISERDAADTGIQAGSVDTEYELDSDAFDVQFSSTHHLSMEVRMARATVGADGALKSLRLNSAWATPESVATIVSRLAKEWDMIAFVQPGTDDDLEGGQSAEPIKRDAIETLQDWVLKPTEGLPAYVAQTKEKPSTEIVILRVMILPQLTDDSGLFCVSVQAFWVSEEIESDEDAGYSERINEVVQLANKQAEGEAATRVADSLVYAAARYAAFAHWSAFEDRDKFTDSKEQFIENCVHAFRVMLQENLDEHLEMFDE